MATGRLEAHPDVADFPLTKARDFRNTLQQVVCRQQDAFDWRFPQRKDLMTLSSIGTRCSAGDADVGFNKYRVERQSRDLYTLDISKKLLRSSAPRHASLDTSDIEGARPRELYPATNKQSRLLSNEDVEGSKVKPMHLKPVIEPGRVQQSHLDLCYAEKPPLERKLIRESLVIDVARPHQDIAGARSSHSYSKLKPHDRSMQAGDWPCSSPKAGHGVRLLDTADPAARLAAGERHQRVPHLQDRQNTRPAQPRLQSPRRKRQVQLL